MKNKFLFLSLLFLFAACQAGDDAFDVLESAVPSMEAVTSQEGHSVEVNAEDAARVAAIFAGETVATRADVSAGQVECIYDAAGNPAIYVVNRAGNQGFVLVGASKNYHPVLAYSNTGYFDTANMPDALKNWIAVRKEDMAYANSLPADSTYLFRAEWAKYEERPAMRQVATRSSQSDLDSYVMDMLSQWLLEGKSYASLSQADRLLPSDVYERWCAIASGSIFPLYEDYMNYSFVLLGDRDNGSKKKEIPFYPRWDQGAGYNAALPPIDGKLPPAGCVTIAMAQVMRHYESPTHYNWAAMPYTYPTSITASFIREVADNVHADYDLKGTGASLSDATSSFVNDYGYSSSIELISHSISRTREEIDDNRLVIMRGAPTKGAVGHAWVVSGYDRIAGNKEYQLWVPIRNASIEEPYNTIDTYSSDYFDYTNICVNWGWGYLENVYVIDTNLKSNQGTYNADRQDIVNIVPGK